MFFRRKSQAPVIPPFNQRVAQFWAWYAAQAERFTQTIDAGSCADLSDEVSAKMAELLPGLAWVFGPGPEKKGGHSFTLSPEGNPHRRLLTNFWLAQAPELPGWTFYASRQPSPDFHGGIQLEIAGQKISAEEIWVTLHPQRDTQLINLSAWHPCFSELPENAAYQIIFILLDEALGEDAVENHIGDIHISNDKLAKSVPIHELREEVESICQNWEAPDARGIYSTYRLPAPDNSFIRSDTLVGSTRHRPLINEFLSEGGRIAEDPIAGTGAQFTFLAFDTDSLPKGEEDTLRGGLEAAIDEALTADHAGEILGGAMGHNSTYVDLLLFNTTEPTIERIRAITQRFGLKNPALYPFFKCDGKPLHLL
ncbi:hypothetical protein [Cerasicoccus maritimus]|uniref:hypothetical protein n=1 Tax=Cerasicoccus maritimus TaxID=490089 RepID=UPI0028525489|nr:hypothetical protein [Cerasicoccus maritimus]